MADRIADSGRRLSVIVVDADDARRAGPTFASLDSQTAAADSFEVLAVGGADREALAVRAGGNVRTVVAPTAGRADQLNTALLACTTPFVTFFDAGDRAGPTLVAALSAPAMPDVVTVTPVVDVTDDGWPGAAPAPWPTPGQAPADPAEAPELLGEIAGRVFEAARAREIAFRDGLGSGLDLDFMVRYWLRRDVRLLAVEPGRGAAYVRVGRQRSVRAQLADRQEAIGDRLALISRLDAERRATTGPVRRHVIDHHVRAAASSMNRYLRIHRDDHHEILAAVHEAEIAAFPFRELNADLATTLLISPASAVTDDAGGGGAAGRTVRRGEIVDVITPDVPGSPGGPGDATRLVEPFIDHHLSIAAPADPDHWTSVASFVDLGLSALRERAAIHGDYRIVRSVAGISPAAHACAALYRARRPSLRWIAELTARGVVPWRRGVRLPVGDPIVIELRHAARARGVPLPATDDAGEFLQLACYALADQLVFTDAAQRDQVLAECRCDHLAARATEISVIDTPRP